jgi:hypothetical protein
MGYRESGPVPSLASCGLCGVAGGRYGGLGQSALQPGHDLLRLGAPLPPAVEERPDRVRTLQVAGLGRPREERAERLHVRAGQHQSGDALVALALVVVEPLTHPAKALFTTYHNTPRQEATLMTLVGCDLHTRKQHVALLR